MVDDQHWVRGLYMADEQHNDHGFFIMSRESIKTLQYDLISVMGATSARSFLFKFGYKCGYINAKGLNLAGQGKEAMNILGEMWIEMGLAKPISILFMDTKIEIVLSETLESSAGGKGCDFTRGFLGGLMTSITNKPHYCVENKCVSRKHDFCAFTLTEEKR